MPRGRATCRSPCENRDPMRRIPVSSDIAALCPREAAVGAVRELLSMAPAAPAEPPAGEVAVEDLAAVCRGLVRNSQPLRSSAMPAAAL